MPSVSRSKLASRSLGLKLPEETKLVDALVFLVVPGVNDDLSGLGEGDGGVLVPQPPEPGVLAGLGLGIEGVDLNDPTVMLGGMGVLRIVEPA
jgi:hypothetical protein